VNLQNKKNERLYASWPYESASDGSDLQVLLYSNLPDKDPIKFGLRIDELNEYLKARYDHLKILRDEINNQFNQSVKDFSNTTIVKDPDPLKQIEILEVEAKKRMNNGYYQGELYELNELFSASLNDPHLAVLKSIFKLELRPYIDELYDHLQRMDFDTEIKVPECINLNLLNTINSYCVGKYIQYLSHGSYDPLIDHYISVFNKLGKGTITFDKDDPLNVSRLKLYLLNFKKQLNYHR
jgi:hypothetical protein